MSHGKNLLLIEVSQLVEAMTNEQIEIVYYLDLKNGNILTINDDDGTGVTEEGLLYGVDYTPELRFLYIEPLWPAEKLRILKLFIKSLTESAVKDHLSKELAARGTVTTSNDQELRGVLASMS